MKRSVKRSVKCPDVRGPKHIENLSYHMARCELLISSRGAVVDCLAPDSGGLNFYINKSISIDGGIES